MEPALAGMLGVAQSKQFDVVEVRSDNEGGVAKLRPDIESLEIKLETAVPGGHVPHVERRIRTIKERVRAQQHRLPFSLPLTLLIWCVYFCVFCINLQRTSGSMSDISPSEAFSGVKLDMRKHIKSAFGDFVHVTGRETDNSMRARTAGGIALMTDGQQSGGTKVYMLQSKRVVTAGTITILPTPDVVIAYLNQQAQQDFHRGVIGRDPSLDIPCYLSDDDSEDEQGEAEPNIPMPGRFAIHPPRGSVIDDPEMQSTAAVEPRRGAPPSTPGRSTRDDSLV